MIQTLNIDKSKTALLCGPINLEIGSLFSKRLSHALQYLLVAGYDTFFVQSWGELESSVHSFLTNHQNITFIGIADKDYDAKVIEKMIHNCQVVIYPRSDKPSLTTQNICDIILDNSSLVLVGNNDAPSSVYCSSIAHEKGIKTIKIYKDWDI